MYAYIIHTCISGTEDYLFKKNQGRKFRREVRVKAECLPHTWHRDLSEE